MNLAAGSQTPLQPNSSCRGLPRGRPSCVFPSFFAPPPVVLAHSGTHLLPSIPHPNIIPVQRIRAEKSRRWVTNSFQPEYRRGVPWSLFHKSSPMIYAKYVKTISDDLPGENMEYGPKVRHSCQSRNPEGPILGEVRLLKQAPCGRPSCVFQSFFAPTPVVLAHAGTHLLPTISHPNINPSAANPCREISPLGHTLLSNLLLPVGASLVVARLVFSSHSSPPSCCPRACGDPSPPHHSPLKHHSERSEAVPRNLAVILRIPSPCPRVWRPLHN